MNQSEKTIDESIEYVLSHTKTEAIVAHLMKRWRHDSNLTTFQIPGYIENQLRVGEGEFMNIPAKPNSRVHVILLREYAEEGDE